MAHLSLSEWQAPNHGSTATSTYTHGNGPKLERVKNPLEWWAAHESRYPSLALLARNVLCIPATSAPTEHLFSYAGLTIADNRASLLPDNAEEIIYLRVAWQKVERPS